MLSPRTLPALRLLLPMLSLSIPAHGKDGVLEGLEIRPAEQSIMVMPGRARINGAEVTVGEKTLLPVTPPETVPVKRESYKNLSSTLPDRWGPGTHFRQTISGGTSLPGVLKPGSVRVELPDGTLLTEGRDYDLNTTWSAIARRAGGAISTDTEVLISYELGQLQLDAVTLHLDGRLTLEPGTPARDTPEVPSATSGTLKLAHIFRPYHAQTIAPWQILPVGPSFPEPDAQEIARRAAAIPRTLAKLRKGEPVTIVTWGDSVTVGADASSPEKGYADLFISRLRARFPGAPITFHKAAIGGTNTNHRLPTLQQEVLDHQPDLMTVEFVNDMPLDEANFRANYAQAISRIRGAGAETILITPHFTMPEMMGHEHPRGRETRPAVGWLREIAKAEVVGLSDTSRRWEHLEVEGLPYLIFLKNGINHPDDRGHEFFVKDLMTFFPAE